MKTLLVSLLLFFLFPACSPAENWYCIHRATKICMPDEDGPAGLIKLLQGLNKHYEVVDEKTENGKPAIVSIQLGYTGTITYYRTKKLCEAVRMERKRAADAEINRYR